MILFTNPFLTGLFLLPMKYLYIFLFLNCISIFSQNRARVTYSIVPTGGSLEKNQEVKNSKVASSFMGVDEALSKLNYELIISEEKSNFYLISIMDFNEKAARIARAFAGNNEYFKDQQKRIVIKKINFSNEIFHVLLEAKSNWILINEHKIINGYVCYKAMQEKKLRLKKTDQTYNVEAWYCPAIPIGNGPKEFGGLPGLIMELQDGKITFLASKIELDSNLKLTIKEVSEKLILEDEFYKIVEKTVESTSGL